MAFTIYELKTGPVRDAYMYDPQLREWVKASGASTIFNEETERTRASARPKPADLYAAGTPFLVTKSINKCDYGEYFDPLTERRFRAPARREYFCTAGYTVYSRVELQNELDGKIRDEIKDAKSNLAESIAEYGQSVKMFHGMAQDIVETFHGLRSGTAIRTFIRNLTDPKTSIEKKIANRWLEYQYGLKPLMGDLFGTVEALASKFQTGIWIYGEAGRSQRFSEDKYVGSGAMRVRQLSRTKISMKAKYRYKISDPDLKKMSQIGLQNPIQLAWELIPYSFVVDQVIPIGQYLGRIDAMVGVSNILVIDGLKHDIYREASGYSGKVINQLLWKERFSPRGNISNPTPFRLRPGNDYWKETIANDLGLLGQLRPNRQSASKQWWKDFFTSL